MKQWYALRSKPKKEASAATLLSRATIEVYLPQAPLRLQRGKPPATVPFFPGYFFGRLDPLMGEIQLARYTPGILHIVGYGGEPCPVPDGLILSIKERLDRPNGSKLPEEFHSGDRVRITGGPFREIEAVFDGYLSASGRARVLIQLLRRMCRVDVHLGQLRPVAEVASVRRSVASTV